MEQFSTKRVYGKCLLTVDDDIVRLSRLGANGYIIFESIEPIIWALASPQADILIYATETRLFCISGNFADTVNPRKGIGLKTWSTKLTEKLRYAKFSNHLIHVQFEDHYHLYATDGKIFLEEECEVIA